MASVLAQRCLTVVCFKVDIASRDRARTQGFSFKPHWLALLAAMGLSACGGGGGADEAILCSFANCKASAEVVDGDLALSADVRQQGASLLVSVKTGYRANLLTVVQLDARESLTAEMSGQRQTLRPGDVVTSPWTAEFPAAGVSPEVGVLLQRADGKLHRSTVQLPAPFRWLSGASAWTGRSGVVDQVVDLPPNEVLGTALERVRCERSDGVVIERPSLNDLGQQPLPATHPQGSLRRLDLVRLAAAVEATLLQGAPVGSSLRQCSFDLLWTRGRVGTTAPTLSKYSSISGRYAQSLSVRWTL